MTLVGRNFRPLPQQNPTHSMPAITYKKPSSKAPLGKTILKRSAVLKASKGTKVSDLRVVAQRTARGVRHENRGLHFLGENNAVPPVFMSPGSLLGVPWCPAHCPITALRHCVAAVPRSSAGARVSCLGDQLLPHQAQNRVGAAHAHRPGAASRARHARALPMYDCRAMHALCV